MHTTPEDHKAAIIAWFSKAFIKKYDIGQIEHTGRLWRKNTQAMLEEEVIDFISYVFTRREQIDEATLLLEKALFTDAYITREKVLQAYYTLYYGNPEGIPEKDK